MEQKENAICQTCAKPLPPNGFFCGKCLTQFKCKACDAPLDADDIGCVNCGTAKEVRVVETTVPKAFNTFKLHETQTDRSIEATFSDTVGKDLAGILRDSYTARRVNQAPPMGQAAPMQFLNGNTDSNEQHQATEMDIDAEVIEEKSKENTSSTNTPAAFPDLVAIAMRNLPSSETEWIVIYAFYASEFGEKMFGREDVLEKYRDSKRFNKTTTKRDLSTYLKRAIAAEYLNPIQENYSLLPKGVDKAKEILGRATSSSPRQTRNRAKQEKAELKNEPIELTPKAKKAQRNGTASPKRLNNLNLAPEGKVSLSDFYNAWQVKNNDERNLLFTYYLQETLGIDAISRDHILTCYDNLELLVPENFKTSISNTITRKGWLQTQNGNISVTVKGTNHLKIWKNSSK